MPASYIIDVKRKLVLSTAEGIFSHADARDHMARLQNDPEFHPSFRQLLDFTRVTSVNLSSGELVELAQHSVFSNTSRRAILTTSDLIFGLARVFEAHREIKGEEGIRIFRKKSEALEWLELDSDEPPPEAA